jgi:serine/threonine-protein kinase
MDLVQIDHTLMDVVVVDREWRLPIGRPWLTRLYKMLTGRQMYSGETVSETLAAVIKDTPDLTALPEATPLEIRLMLRRCLEKDPHHRLQAIGEARCTLELPREDEEQPKVSLSAPRRTVVPWLLSAVLGLMVVAGAALLWRATRPVLHPLMRFSADLGSGAVAGELFTAAISPDGNRIVYLVRDGDTTRLATRLLAQSKSTILAGTEDAEAPFFSPDGQWIGFIAANSMKKIPAQGGAALPLSTVSTGRGASWGEDGYIIANLDLAHLYRVPATGGTPQMIAKPEDKGQINYRFPQILPGGEAVLVSAGARGAFEDGSIAVLSLKTGDLKIVERGGYFARYLPSGHLIYMHQGKLFGVPFNAQRLETRGMPTVILDDVATEPGVGSAQLDFSQTGTLLYLSGRSRLRPQELVWMEASGKERLLLTTTGHIAHPRLSPDGKRVALSLDRDVSVYDLQQRFFTHITFTATGNQSPVWTPDGKHIVYAVQSGSMWTRADGSSQPQRILETKVAVLPNSFSPDGRRLAFSDAQAIWILPLDTADPDQPKPGKPELFVTETAVATSPAFSPDGQWLAYGSGLHIYVQPYPARPGKWQVSVVPGRFPIWSEVVEDSCFTRPRTGRLWLLIMRFGTIHSFTSGRGFGRKSESIQAVPKRISTSHPMASASWFFR